MAPRWWSSVVERKGDEVNRILLAALCGMAAIPPVVASGWPDGQAYFQRGIDAGGHIDAIQILSGSRSSDLAYWVGTYEATNAGQRVRGRNVVVVRQVTDRWLIVAHESVVSDQP
jgi:hypothetical protein